MRTHENRHGSVIDVVLLFLLIALICGAILRGIDRYADGGSPTATAVVTLSVAALPAQGAACISLGDLIYHTDGTPFGTVENIEITPARIELEDNGVLRVGTPTDEQCDLLLRVRIDGSFRESTLFEGGRYALPIAKQMTLYTDLVALHATVVATEA